MANVFDLGNVLRKAPPEQPPMPEAMDVAIETDNPDAVSVDARTGVATIRHADGSVTIDATPPSDEEQGDSEHGDNLADDIDAMELARIADELLRGIQQDEDSRKDWLDNRAEGIDLLGLELKRPGEPSGANISGTSKVNSSALIEAVLRFQANARGELLPTDGPVKVRNDGVQDKVSDEEAQALEDDLNHYLTTTASEYYPDTDRMLLFVGFGGCGFKKVYHCPIRRRPVSESVDAKDLIVSNAATDLKSCGRVTQAVKMRPSTLKRMQLLGAYRDVHLPDGMPKIENPVDQKIAQVEGVQPNSQAMEAKDRDRDLYECYCEIDIKGFEHKEKDKLTGLPLPYKVTLDRQSREVLEVRRNWDADDEQCLAKTTFVKYPFVPGFGFYDIGLLSILGNSTLALTAALRECLDAGMYANFPGFLYLKSLGKQLTNEFRVPPGGGLPIDIAGVNDIRSAIMPLPYSTSGMAPLMALMEKIEQNAQRLGGTAELPVGEGKQDAPVGTTLALIEQATKIIDAVHKRLHGAQAQELQILTGKLREDPEALWRHNKKSKLLKMMMTANGDGAIVLQQEQAQEALKRKVIAALNDCDLVPQADPNTSSQMMRIMKAIALVQLATTSPPGMFDLKQVAERALRAMRIDDAESLFLPPQPQQEQPPDPKLIKAFADVQQAQTKQAEFQFKQEHAAADLQNDQAQQATDRYVADKRVEMERIIHMADQQIADAQSRRKLIGDAMEAETQRRHDLTKHTTGLLLDHAKHQSGLQADQTKHHTELASDHIQQMRDHAHQRAMGGTAKKK